MTDKTKPSITATIKFRGVTIEGMTVQELRELRDVLNELVGDKVIERRDFVPYPQPSPFYVQPPYSPVWATTTTTDKITLDGTQSRVGGNTITDKMTFGIGNVTSGGFNVASNTFDDIRLAN